MKLSVVIATYNRFNSLKISLDSVFKNLPDYCEVIVVDQSANASEQKDYFIKKYPQIIYICEKQKNLPNARNIGIKNSQSSIILFLDDDIVMYKNCIESHINYHRDNKNPLVAGRTIQSGEIKWAEIKEISYLDFGNAETAANFDNKKLHDNLLFAVGCHFSIKKSIINKIGYFDNAFKGNALYEDIDFSFRVRKKGYNIVFNPNSIIEHHTESTGGCRDSQNKDYYLDMLHNRTLFYLKNISIIPSFKFLTYLKYLSEYICRIKKGFYSPYYLLKVLLEITYSYFHCFTSKLRTRVYK